MKAIKILFAAAVIAITAVACSSQKQVQGGADTIGVTCNPKVLEVVGDKINADININFPSGYFKTNSMMVLTPVIVYAEGQRTGKAVIYQGEKIKANYRVIPLKGGQHTQSVSFDFVKGMEQCVLELQCKMMVGDKTIDLPSIKVADGCIATYKLADLGGEFTVKDDGFQQITTHTTETSIMFE